MADTWHGKSGENLQKAIEAAWDAAKGEVTPPAEFTVDEISFKVSNPISEYSVVIKKKI